MGQHMYNWISRENVVVVGAPGSMFTSVALVIVIVLLLLIVPDAVNMSQMRENYLRKHVVLVIVAAAVVVFVVAVVVVFVVAVVVVVVVIIVVVIITPVAVVFLHTVVTQWHSNV